MFCSVAPIQQIRILIFTTVNERSSLWGADDDLSESEWTEARNVFPAAHYEKLMYLVNECCFQAAPAVILFPVAFNFISNLLSLHLNVKLCHYLPLDMHTSFPYSGRIFGYFCHLQPGHCFLSLSQWCRTFIISVREAAAASIYVLTLPSGVCLCVWAREEEGERAVFA